MGGEIIFLIVIALYFFFTNFNWNISNPINDIKPSTNESKTTTNSAGVITLAQS